MKKKTPIHAYKRAKKKPSICIILSENISCLNGGVSYV